MTTAAPKLSGAHLLIADDDVEFVEFMNDFLAAHDAASVTSAFSGADALDALANQGPFDLLVTDQRMPGPNGVQLVTMARYAGYRGPILIVTAYPGPEVDRTVGRYSDVEIVRKTSPPVEIIHAAARLLGRGV